MNYLHHEFDAGPNDTIEVLLDHPANVQVMDGTNFQNYRAGRSYRYHGGYATTSPYELHVPNEGKWHLVVDLGGYPGTVRATVRVISGIAT